MLVKTTMGSLILSVALLSPAALLAKEQQQHPQTPVASQASVIAKQKSATKPGKPVKHSSKVQTAQVPELDRTGAGLALLVLGGLVLLMRETRQRA